MESDDAVYDGTCLPRRYLFTLDLKSSRIRQNLCTSLSDYYYPHNVSRSTLSGIAEYRSALTLDWLAAEDSRQRELALAFETETAAPVQMLASDCVSYGKPASGKVARLMLELLKNLEGDEGTLIPELIQALIRTKLLVETSLLEAEPDLESLVKTPGVMMGEPHTTFPRILAMCWMAATDPTTVKKNGWCPITKVTKYLLMTRPMLIAKHIRNLDPVIARARFIMEEFIQHVTPNMYDKKNLELMRTTSMNEIRRTTSLHSKLHNRYRPSLKTRYLPKHKLLESPPTSANPSTITSSFLTQVTFDQDDHQQLVEEGRYEVSGTHALALFPSLLILVIAIL